MKTLIIANWKMNPATKKEAVNLFNAVKKGIKNVKKVEVVICPPFIYLPLFSGLTLGAQNVFYKEGGRLPSTTFASKSGAGFTGEISPLQICDLKVKYIIIGHSEVRKYLNETNEIINKKIKEILAVKLKPILCIGENTDENKFKILEEQITGGLKGVSGKDLKNIVIAYEPVWAIGTGKNCSLDQTLSSILFVRKIISKLYNREISDRIIIIYGGSVNSGNAVSYIEDGGAGGLLVGGASLNVKEFIAIIKSFSL